MFTENLDPRGAALTIKQLRLPQKHGCGAESLPEKETAQQTRSCGAHMGYTWATGVQSEHGIKWATQGTLFVLSNIQVKT